MSDTDKRKEQRRLELEEKLKKITEDARQKADVVKAKIARLEQADRAADTRRKILIGACVMNLIENGDPAQSAAQRELLKAALPGFITREKDRDLLAAFLRNDQPQPKDAATPTVDTLPTAMVPSLRQHPDDVFLLPARPGTSKSLSAEKPNATLRSPIKGWDQS